MELLNYEKVSTELSLFLREQDKVFCFFSIASGTGKTYFLRRYCQEHKSAFYMHLPQSIAKSPRMILLGLLYSLEVPFIKSASVDSYLDILRLELIKKQLSVIIIDDIQVIDVEIFELFKRLADEIDLKFIFAGTEIPDLYEHVAEHSEILSAV
ncbi:DNA transposition AAA+ family ATPase [Paenibacillus phyllosphaerae]|uniref:DNA transposition AAA+ family ATPase n=1 Tax=Paenibacillus phyllosphaerae TaxID=274593 RepID=A0A7W5FPH1_9BACL|nr:AAA family ATPase [Paenibacillus phyllosphaerae]MBB3112361.1 DNA transposition AAA+ family ATPase [Paenibacillus phyllosphaerae]